MKTRVEGDGLESSEHKVLTGVTFKDGEKAMREEELNKHGGFFRKGIKSLNCRYFYQDKKETKQSHS